MPTVTAIDFETADHGRDSACAKWRLPSARLPAVCAHLGIPLDHHNAISDAEACARIAIAAL